MSGNERGWNLSHPFSYTDNGMIRQKSWQKSMRNRLGMKPGAFTWEARIMLLIHTLKVQSVDHMFKSTFKQKSKKWCDSPKLTLKPDISTSSLAGLTGFSRGRTHIHLSLRHAKNQRNQVQDIRMVIGVTHRKALKLALGE